jgi:type II secretory pathway component PulF
MEQGADAWKSMADVGILSRPEMRALHTAERFGNRAWVLQQLARVKMRRAAARADRWSKVVLPVLVIVLGAFVLLHAISVFVPLTQLIDALG